MSISISQFLVDVRFNQYTYKTYSKKKVREADTNVQEFQESLSEFQKKVKKLRKYDSKVTTSEKVKTQISDMVKSYNTLLTKYSNTDNKDISKNMKKLEQIFDDNSSTLKKIGVRKDGNTWKFSENSFDSLETSKINKYCTQLFTGRKSFINQVNVVINKIDKCAEEAEYNTKIRKIPLTVKYSKEEISTAQNLLSIKNNIFDLTDYVKNVEIEPLENDEYKLEAFASMYDRFISNSENIENQYVQAIKNYHKDDDIKTQLAKIGIIIDDENNMTYNNAECITKDNAYCNTFKALFAEDSLYVKTMQTLCKNAINDLLKSEKYGIAFDKTT